METKKIKDPLQEAMDTIKKKFGSGAVTKLESDDYPKIEAIPTGVPALDEALGIGGIPKGRMIEIWGKESTGKSTLALKIIAETQKQGGKVMMIDVEHTLDLEYASKIGVNTKELYFSQPNSGEEALQICETFIQSKKMALIVIDTVAALTPMAELKDDVGMPQIALQARLMSQSLRRLTAIVHKNNTAILFLNQVRTDIMKKWGDKEIAPGGLALKFYASVRIHLKRIKLLEEHDEPVGLQIEANIVKNKVAPPFKKAIFEIFFKPKTDEIKS